MSKRGSKMQANVFKAYLALRGYTIRRLAKEMGISPKTLSEKIKGKYDFTMTEAKTICTILEIDKPGDIFFT